MPRHYTSEEHDYAMERLIANRGDVYRTASELGISRRTLYDWRKSAQPAQIESVHLQNLQQNVQIQPQSEQPISPLPTDDLQALRDLKDQMLRVASTLSHSIEEAIAEASLGQRVTALAQLTDRIVKLAAQLPSEDEEDWLEGTEDEERDEDWDETEEAANSPSYSETGFE